MWSLLLMIACDGEPTTAPPPPPPPPAPVAAPAPPPAPAPVAAGEPPDHWPVGTAPGPDGTYTVGPVRGERTTYGAGFETFHGGYGALVAVKASSSLSAQGTSSYGAGNLDDDDYRTAWVEGVDGDGVGEWVEFTFVSGEPGWTCGGLSIVNGYQKSAAAFRDNSRVKALDIFSGGERRGRLELEDRTGEQFFKVPVDLNARVRLVVAEVYPGAKYKDTAITEMWVACGP